MRKLELLRERKLKCEHTNSIIAGCVVGFSFMNCYCWHPYNGVLLCFLAISLCMLRFFPVSFSYYNFSLKIEAHFACVFVYLGRTWVLFSFLAIFTYIVTSLSIPNSAVNPFFRNQLDLQFQCCWLWVLFTNI